jgi:hypothetical protein
MLATSNNWLGLPAIRSSSVCREPMIDGEHITGFYLANSHQSKDIIQVPKQAAEFQRHQGEARV